MIIGITGGIGSGKSRVARYWSTSFRIPLFCLDALCRQLLQKDKAGWQAIAGRFGSQFLRAGGELDRVAFREALFSDSMLRKEIDELLHPLARKVLHELIDHEAKPVVLVEVPLLFEAGWQQEADRIVVVYADLSTRLRRIITRDDVDPEQAGLAIKAQLPLEEKILMADHVIDNSGAWVHTRQQVAHLGRLYGSREGDVYFREKT